MIISNCPAKAHGPLSYFTPFSNALLYLRAGYVIMVFFILRVFEQSRFNKKRQEFRQGLRILFNRVFDVSFFSSAA